jgi:hypothetical protein
MTANMLKLNQEKTELIIFTNVTNLLKTRSCDRTGLLFHTDGFIKVHS